MGKHSRTLKTLRDIALEYGSTEQPDLASMARELGRVVHEHAPALANRLAPLRARQRGFERWLLAERSKPALSVLVMAWPPNHLTPVHDHAGLWGLEVALAGALEVQSYTRDPASGDLRMQGRDWLGPGDGTWIEGDENQHDGSQRVGEPAPIACVSVHHRNDQRRRHGRRDQSDALCEQLHESQTVFSQC